MNFLAKCRKDRVDSRDVVSVLAPTGWHIETEPTMPIQTLSGGPSMPSTLSLDELVARARQHKVTPQETRAQRLSMVMGLRSHNSSLTREQAETLLGEIEGHEPSIIQGQTSSR